MKKDEPPGEEYEVVFRASVRTRSGRVIFAHWYGLKGFPIKVKKK